MIDKIGTCRVVGEIGAGGMAVVYKAVQEPLGRTVAIKMLKPQIAKDTQFAKRFEREALFMATLQHENILHVHDFIKDHDTLSIVMEYVEGIDLFDLLDKTPRMPADVAAIVALQVARALDYAHYRGIIHRDIKPANIMISNQGEVKLMDFGIARDENLTDLTEAGTGLGTPSYMSPEQILGDKLDARSDIFSLGIVLYQMITGQKPFNEDGKHTVMQKIRLERPESPRRIQQSIPRALERIISRCMQKMPSSRYPTVQTLIDDLMKFLATRVSMNYHGRIVLYLRDLGVISAEYADQILTAGAPRTVEQHWWSPRWVREAAYTTLGVATGVGLTLGAVQAIQTKHLLVDQTKTGPTGFGLLRVNAHPWADVYVDQKKVMTTPDAAPVILSPGKHIVKFIHPQMKPETREVIIKAGEPITLDVALVAQTKGKSP